MAALIGMSIASCSEESDSSNETPAKLDSKTDSVTNELTIVNPTPIVDQDSYPANTKEENYTNKSFGNAAMNNCATLGKDLRKANEIIGKANLTDLQKEYIYKVLENLVNNVYIPTYTSLADETEKLESILKGLTSETITQEQVNSACAAFKEARKYWERSEAFLGGPASDFDIDPTIDSWPLNRSLLLTYFKEGMNEEMLEDATILGFHALEFILFRNGQPRKVAELKGNDTYVNFESVTGAEELKYAQTICTLLKERTYQLQVSWEGKTDKNASRMAVVVAANLDYTTEKGLSYGVNLTQAGKNSKSTFTDVKQAVAQVLSNDEGSCFTICNEVGTAKIANPFATGDIAYVESPYSYNSITDFADNIRSIRNVWLGSTDKTSNKYSFHSFFASVEQATMTTSIENDYVAAIQAIATMPSPFVKYCSKVWGKNFDDPENWESTSE